MPFGSSMRLGCCGLNAGSGGIGICFQLCRLRGRRWRGGETKPRQPLRSGTSKLSRFTGHLLARLRRPTLGLAGGPPPPVSMMPDRAIGVDENFVGDAADVGFGHLVDAVDRAEQFTPIAIARLIGGQLRGESFIVGQAANQIGFGCES